MTNAGTQVIDLQVAKKVQVQTTGAGMAPVVQTNSNVHVSPANILPPPIAVSNTIGNTVEIVPSPAGITSLQLAQRYGYQIVGFVEPDASPETILTKHLQVLLDVVPLAEAELKNKPHMGTIYALTNLMEATRNTLADLRGQIDVEGLQMDLEEQIVNQLVQSIIQHLTKHVGTYKTVTENYLRPERKDQADAHLKDMVRAFGNDLKNDRENILTTMRHLVYRAIRG